MRYERVNDFCWFITGVATVFIALFILSSVLWYYDVSDPPVIQSPVEPPKQDVIVDIGRSGIDIKWDNPIWDREK